MTDEEQPDTRGHRIYLIREALGSRRKPLALEKFAKLIEETTGAVYDKSVLSRKEEGKIPVSIDDIDAIAPVDPLGRGKAWLACWTDRPTTPTAKDAIEGSTATLGRGEDASEYFDRKQREEGGGEGSRRA